MGKGCGSEQEWDVKHCRRKEGFWDGSGWGMESLVYSSGGKEARVAGILRKRGESLPGTRSHGTS